MRRWYYSRWAALGYGILGGALVGLAVYAGSRLSGPALFVLCGTVAGGAGMFIFTSYARVVRLTSLTVKVPHLSDMTFAVTPNNTEVAWRLFVESITRISTQSLGERGLLREAMSSLHALFQTVRKTLAEAQPSLHNPGAKTVEHLAIAMLNLQIRPFLATWHPRLSAWEAEHGNSAEAGWPDNARCRAELEACRLVLVDYVRGLGELAGVSELDVLLADRSTAPALPGQPTRAFTGS